jgi:hypothetical protein
MKIKMKPETIERRARERAEARTKGRAELLRRLREKAEIDPEGPWAEMRAEVLREMGEAAAHEYIARYGK